MVDDFQIGEDCLNLAKIICAIEDIVVIDRVVMKVASTALFCDTENDPIAVLKGIHIDAVNRGNLLWECCDLSLNLL